MGIRLVIYIDDILLMASLDHLIQGYTYIALFLLGFIVKIPCQYTGFLGMMVNSQDTELKLPEEKNKDKYINKINESSNSDDITVLLLTSKVSQADLSSQLPGLHLSSQLPGLHLSSQLPGLPVNSHAVSTGNRGTAKVRTAPLILE